MLDVPGLQLFFEHLALDLQVFTFMNQSSIELNTVFDLLAEPGYLQIRRPPWETMFEDLGRLASLDYRTSNGSRNHLIS